MARKLLTHNYKDVISAESLLAAWAEFVKGKRARADVQAFGRDLMANLLALHRSLADRTYRHGPYMAFSVSDPKPRQIHKATVADRIVHRALHRTLYPFFDRTFIHDSYACRLGKGVHRARDRFRVFARQASQNHRRTVWVLSCDVRKFFASINHDILNGFLGERIADARLLWLTEEIAGSFNSGVSGVGLPLGNLTSQLFANVYLNEFDHFVKHQLRIKHYLRYADDFVILDSDKRRLNRLLPPLAGFLARELSLALHPDKVSIRSFASGVDFLGWVHFPEHRVLRPTTRRRVIAAVSNGCGRDSFTSYIGLLRHGNAFKLRERMALTGPSDRA